MTAPRPILWKSLQAVARLLTTLLFDLKIYGRACVPKRGGVLIVSNHQGNLDPVVLGVGMSRPLNYLAKSELFESNPGFNWLLRSLGGIPVRLGSGDVGAVKETIRRLQQGYVLNIYPEGARTADGEIGPMEKGVALVVRRAKVPVVPAVIVGSFEAWPVHRRFPRFRPVHVRYGRPMSLDGLEPDQILATIDETLRRMFEDLRSNPGPACCNPLSLRPPQPPEGQRVSRTQGKDNRTACAAGTKRLSFP